MKQLKRRDSVKTSSSMLVGASLIGTSHSWAGANDRIRVALIGAGDSGGGLIQEAIAVEGVEVSVICDPDERRMAEKADALEKRTGKRPKTEVDLRRIMDDSSIDVVTIASCEHWHALTTIWAYQANKHVLGYPFNRTRPGPQFSRGASQEGAPGSVGARALAAAWTALPGAAWWR